VAAAEVEAHVRAGEAAEARAALGAADERFRATFEQAAVGIAHVALDGRWLRVNRRLCEVVGYAPDELLARTFQAITHPDDLAADLDHVGRLVVGEIPWYRMEKRYLHRQGHAVWTMLTVSLVRDAGGRAEYFIAVVEDVSDRKRAEAALAASEAELRAAQVEVLERLAQAAEVRDDDTGLHTRRVGELSARIAAALGLPDADVALIRQAAPLHDVGKIGVPDAVLLKAGRLTAAEFAVIQEHAALGARILAGSAAPLTRLAEAIAHAHHERWDGAGYPRGLAGEAIPLAARIVAVADVYDALTNARPYRGAWPEEAVIDHIRAGAGTHFDPAVVAAFLRLRTGVGVAGPATGGHGVADAAHR
ncbi:MAG: Metal dependent phosphohydrolase, HD region, partial [uncultured Gemmatimonadaceae bacterium]